MAALPFFLLKLALIDIWVMCIGGQVAAGAAVFADSMLPLGLATTDTPVTATLTLDLESGELHAYRFR